MALGRKMIAGIIVTDSSKDLAQTAGFCELSLNFTKVHSKHPLCKRGREKGGKWKVES